MNLKILLTSVLILMLVGPSLGLAQMSPPCRFWGTVTVDGKSASDDAVITAWIDDEQVAQAAVSDGEYTLDVDSNYAGKTVSFQVNDIMAAQTGTCEIAETLKLNLTALTPLPDAVGEPGLNISPEKGINITLISGDNFIPLSEIIITWNGVSVTTYPPKPIADQEGAFSAIIFSPTQDTGEYVITATDSDGRSAEATFTQIAASGETGDTGQQGLPGERGPQGDTGITGEVGPQGPSGDSGLTLVLAIVALCIAVISVILAFALRSKQPPAG